MRFLEKNLEDIIYHSKKDLLIQRGLDVCGLLKRQLNIGNYGIADLIELRRPYYHTYFNKMVKGHLIVYELKKEKIDIHSLVQAAGYAKGIVRYLKKRNKEDFFDITIRLVGKSIDLSSSFIYLADIFGVKNYSEELIGVAPRNCLEIFTYKYEIDGISFEQCSEYNLIYEGF